MLYHIKCTLLLVAFLLLAISQTLAKPPKSVHKKIKNTARTNTASAAPTISYSGPQNYVTNRPITPLVPTSTGVAPFGFSTTRVQVGSGFTRPMGLTVDAQGNIYVTDNTAAPGNGMVKKILADGSSTVTIATGLVGPRGLTLSDDGNIAVADMGGHSIKKVLLSNGSIQVVSSNLANPVSVSYDGSWAYIADLTYSDILYADGSALPMNGVTNPTFIVVKDKYQYIAANDGIHSFSTFEVGRVVGKDIVGPLSLAADFQDNIYVYDHVNKALKLFPADGSAAKVLASDFGASPAGYAPGGVAIDYAGNVYVADTYNNRVDKIVPVGGYFLSPASLPPGLHFDSNTGIISGTPIGGDYAPQVYTITAYNSTGSTSTTVTIGESYDRAQLRSVTPSKGSSTLTPSFRFPDTTRNYRITVPYIDSVISFTPIASSSGSTIKVNGIAVASGNASAGIPLIAGRNDITVTCDNGTWSNTYIFRVSRAPALASLTPDEGFLTPGFNKDIFSYRYNVPNLAGSTRLKPVVSDTSQRIKVNGVAVASGSFSASIPLDVGNNIINTEVTSRDGSVSTIYSTTVSRAPLPPTVSYAGPQTFFTGTAISPLTPNTSGGANFAFSSIPIPYNIQGKALAIDTGGNLYYNNTQTNNIDKLPPGGNIPVTIATNFPAVAITVDLAGNVYVANSTQVSRIAAGGGAPVLIATGLSSITGMAIDRTGSLYLISSTSQSIIKIPAGGGAQTLIATGKQPIYITKDNDDTLYILANNGDIVKYYPVTTKMQTIPAAEGYTAVTAIAVDASYNIFLRLGANISMLRPGASYPSSVLNPVLTSGKLYIATDNKDNLYINGNNGLQKIPLFGGYLIRPILPDGLSMDKNTGIISGNATVGSPATDYTVTSFNPGGSASAVVNIKVVSTIASLSALKINKGLLNFVSQTSVYNITVPNSVSAITLTPTATDSTANILVNGSPVFSGKVSPAVPLSVGNNTVTVKVTAPDGVTTRTYTLNITRLASPAINYSSPHLYTTNTAIAPLTPSSSNIGALGFSNTDPAVVYSGKAVDVRTDFAGNVYFAGITSTTPAAPTGIFKINASSGVIDTVAKNFGDGGNHINYDFTIDPAGNIYVLQLSANNVLKIPAGGGARVNIPVTSPIAITTDPKGNIYVINNISKLYKIPVNGTSPILVTTPATTLFGGLAADALGNIYLATQIGLVKILPDGSAQTVLTGFTVSNLTLDNAGNLYINDVSNRVLKMLPAAGGAAVSLMSNFSSISKATISPTGEFYYINGSLNGVQKLITTGGYFIKPTLPNGLNFNVNTGTISGTPTTPLPLTNYIVNAYLGGDSNPDTVGIKIGTNNPFLSGLQLSKGTLNPVFTPAVTGYTATVSYADSLITVTPSATDSVASVKVNDVAVNSGHTSPGIHLNLGPNTISTVVTSSDGTVSKTYTTTVTRLDFPPPLASLTVSDGTLSPAFADSTMHYNVTVPNATTNLTVTPTAKDAGAVITVNGISVASGTASAAIPLNNGANTVTVSVSQAGHPAANYIISVLRISSNASLGGLSISTGTVLTPTSVAGVTNFNTSVDYGATSVTVTPTTADANATVTVNGVSVSSGTPSGAINLNATGSTVINILVTSQNGNTRPYTITVSKNGSSNAALKGLTLSSGTILNAAPVAGISHYTTSVAPDAISIALKPVAADSNAVITLNGTIVPSGTLSQPVALNASGATTINLLVTAQDGVTTRTYSVTVNKTGSSNANCAIALSPATALNKVVGTDDNFTATVGLLTDTVLVRTYAADANASVLVNGVTVSNGSSGTPVLLNKVGPTVVNVLVTAQDGVTKKNYSITITKVPKGYAYLKILQIGSLNLNPLRDTSVFNYITTTPSNQVSVTARPADVKATVSVTGVLVYNGRETSFSGTPTAPFWYVPIHELFNAGTFTFTIKVTAADGVTTKTYTVVLTNSLSLGFTNSFAASQVTGNGEVNVHQALSPNGDGIDDYLTVDGIGAHPDNTLYIMDVNGKLLATRKQYDNVTHVFDGHADNNTLQKPGTYYYVLKYKDGGQEKTKTGFIILRY
ncbi:cadherin-like beta sandwich domain-containing protein [Mucilaginibacter celer]|nr:cadherin-like beta sandwich domain-containing protein [Mucilaginibacter celer]